MKSRRIGTIIIGIALIASMMFQKGAFAGTAAMIDAQGNVTWNNDKTDPSPIGDTVPPRVPPNDGKLVFGWTKGALPTGELILDSDYDLAELTNRGGQGISVHFFRPNDPAITDWRQALSDGKGGSIVISGNIKRGSPWTFHPLSELPIISWRIPDLAPREANSDLFIYTAVNLDIYFTQNPQGFLGGSFMVGQTLDDLGISVVNGQIPGLDGIYFSTSDFLFDPNSATGFVPAGGSSALLNSADFQAANGAIGIIGVHEAVPEPSTLTLFGLGTLVMLSYGWRQHKKNSVAKT
jgi:hypothetical protein